MRRRQGFIDRRRNVLLLLLSCSLAACTAVTPGSQMDRVNLELPGRWTATKEARAGIDTEWVDRLGGREAEQLVEKALAANPDMQVAAERVTRAVANARLAGASFRPQVTADLDRTRSRQNFPGLPLPGGSSIPSSLSTSWGASLNVSWEPDVWGKARAGQAAALAEVQAEQQAYRAARASLAAQVVRGWLAVAEARAQIQLAVEANSLRQTTYEIVLDRFRNALTEDGGSAAQFRLAESELESGRADLAQRQGALKQAQRQLEILLGSYPEGLLTVGEEFPVIPPLPPAGLPSTLLLRRPDILEAERRFVASGKRKEQGRLAFYPSFSLTGSAGRRSNEVAKLLDSDLGVWSLGAGMTQPIWNAGRLRADLSRLASDERASLARLQRTVLNAVGEVEQALSADHYLAERIQFTQAALGSAKEAAQAARENYVGGTGEVLIIIDAERNRVNLAAAELSLRRLRLDNRVTLHLALGGSYQISK